MVRDLEMTISRREMGGGVDGRRGRREEGKMGVLVKS